MNYIRLAVILSVVWAVMIWVFSLGLDLGESFHFVHYFWLAIAAGAVVWMEWRRYKKMAVIGNPI